MLARAYIEAEDPEQAEATTIALIAKEPLAYLRMIEVARLYLQTDKVEHAARLVAGISEQMLAEGEENQLLELINELLTSDADNVPALRLLVSTYWWQRDVDNLKAALERLAEAAEAAGLVKDERHALTQLTRLAPEQTQHVARLNELGGTDEEAAAEVMAAFEPAAHSDPQTVSSIEEESVSESKTPSAPAGETEFEWNSVAETTGAGFEEMELERGFAFEGEPERLPASPAEPKPNSQAVEEDRHAAIRTQELESVDFYITQGYVDIAVDTLNLLENQFGAHPDIERRRQQLKSLSEGAPVVVESEPSMDSHSPISEDELAPAADDSPAEAPALTAQVIDPGLAEVFEEYRASAEVDSNGNGDYETHYNLGLAYKEMDLFEEALEEFQTAASLVSPDDGTSRYVQCCNLLGHCFMQKGVPQLAVKWLNKGLSAPSVSDDERQALRFELAAAHEQAGDLNRAMDLFTEVYGVNVSYRGVNERLRALQSRLAQ